MHAQTIFVRSLPASASNERLEEIFSEIGPVKQCFVVKEKETGKCRGFGYVTFSMEEDSQRALKEIKEYDGQRLSLSVAKKKVKDKRKTASKEPDPEAPQTTPTTPTTQTEKEQKSKGLRKKNLKSRLIIRNLSFKCSEADLKEVFTKFGTVLEAKIPLKPDGKMRGFAFVLFKNVSEAARALHDMNLKEIKGRQVAVDWAVPKDKFVSMQPPTAAGNKKTEETVTKQAEAEQQSDAEDKEEEEEEKKQAAPEKKKVASKTKISVKQQQQQQEEEESQSDEEEDDDDEDDEDDDDDDEDDGSEAEEIVSQKGKKEEKEEEEEEDDADDDDRSDMDSHDDDDDDDEEDDDDDDDEDKAAEKKRKPLPTDVKEGRTIFIRNLSFDTEEDGLEEVLLKYGELNYIKIVVHPDTEHSKGCAFAQFKTKESADKCIAAAQDDAENGGIRVDGRKLLIVAAVSREDAVKLKTKKVKVESGVRNLYLAREGWIRAGTKAAEGVPEADMTKRTRFEEMKRAKLRDINIFVSKNRLCVHNLPKSLDNKKLRALCLEAVKGRKGVRLTECRIMYDKKPEKGQVMGQSLGYGFVQYQEHEHALSTLRHLNNNPSIFGPNKRPIVEFSLEDSRKLKIKELRRQKSKESFRKPPFKGGDQRQSQANGDRKGFNKGGMKAAFSAQQSGKEKAAHPNQRQNNHSGFQTRPEVEHIEMESGKKRRKVLPLPSHRGPKIRMRDKGKQQAPPPKKAKPGSSRSDRQRWQMEKPTQPRNQKVKTPKKNFRRGDGDHFDTLVEKYKKKIIGSGDKNTAVKRNKWFNS